VITFEPSVKSMSVTLLFYFSGEKLSEFHPDAAVLGSFVGEYRSPELDDAVHLSVEQGP